jgi:beta-aspartyl-peptidase (threonine type)
MKTLSKALFFALLFAAGWSTMSSAMAQEDAARGKIMLVIQGVAGAITRSELSPELEQEYRVKLTEALEAGHRILKGNGSSLDAVEAVIRILEDSPLFNAGKGAVFTHEGKNELDASIMDGSNLKAGAVAGVKHIQNPISLARMVMEKSSHVMMVADGAEQFAKSQGVELVPEKYFHTERRWKELETKKSEKADGHGTVGVVALDAAGNLAAGTSTGGMVNKRFGRVGDSPIIGAGTYADNQTCAVSATGDGEYFIRASVAHDIVALVGYKGVSVNEAAAAVLEKVKKLGGTGGVIVLDRAGNFATPFNTAGMYRGHIGPDGKAVVAIYQD